MNELQLLTEINRKLDILIKTSQGIRCICDVMRAREAKSWDCPICGHIPNIRVVET